MCYSPDGFMSPQAFRYSPISLLAARPVTERALGRRYYNPVILHGTPYPGHPLLSTTGTTGDTPPGGPCSLRSKFPGSRELGHIYKYV